MSIFKPMLSATVNDTKALQFPLLGSPKLDGIRAVVRGGVLVSRSLKPIPNKWAQTLFNSPRLEGLDGELVVGPANAPDVFRNTTAGVMTIEGEPDVRFYVFDHVGTPELPFHQRLVAARDAAAGAKRVDMVRQTPIADLESLDVFESRHLELGYEGVMLRSRSAAYKYGRATFKEHGLMKLKRFEDAEARIVGFEELQHNANEATTNALGAKERSTKRAGMVGKNTLGALKVVGLNGTYKGVEFNIGSGFDAATRNIIWMSRAKWTGMVVKYKYFPIGALEAPRFPVFLGIRPEQDR